MQTQKHLYDLGLYAGNKCTDNSQNFTTSTLLTIGHMPMFVVSSSVIHMYRHGYMYGSINLCTEANDIGNCSETW